MPVIDDPHALSSRLIDRGLPAETAKAIAAALHDVPAAFATETSLQAVRTEIEALRGEVRLGFANQAAVNVKLAADIAALPNALVIRLVAAVTATAIALFGLWRVAHGIWPHLV